jgi:hypothetical protein
MEIEPDFESRTRFNHLFFFFYGNILKLPIGGRHVHNLFSPTHPSIPSVGP